MHGIASRQRSIPQNNLLRTLYHDFVNCQHLIYYTEQCVKSRLNCVAAIDGDVPVQNFLHNLGNGNKTLTVGDQFLEQTLCVSFVTMRCTDQINSPASCVRCFRECNAYLNIPCPAIILPRAAHAIPRDF